MEINVLLKNYWAWSGQTKEAFAVNGCISDDKEVYYYSGYGEMVICCEEMVKKGDLSAVSIDNILTVMAIDYENENILDMLVSCLNDNQLLSFVKIGRNHMQPNARWQIIELIVKKKSDNYLELLKEFIDDKDFYVKQRLGKYL